MRVLLTGANGFIGSHVGSELTGRGHEAVPFEGDLRERISVDAVDFIIDVASRAEVSESLENPYEFISDNIQMTLRVLEYARKIKPLKVVHVSSAEVYGPGTHTINNPHRPSNPYGASKGAQDTICRAYREAYGVPVSLAITQNVWGEGQPERKFYPQIKKRIESGEEVTVLPGIRKFIEVGELATRIVDLLTEPVGDYHLAGEKMTNLEFAQKIARDLNKELRIKEVSADRPGHEYEYILL